LIASVLGTGCSGQSDVREASLKHHFKFNDVGTHYAGTVQDTAIHLEVSDTVLEDQLSKALSSTVPFAQNNLMRRQKEAQEME